MRKITIDNQSYLNDIDAIDLVRRVIKGGKMVKNNTQYPYSTTLTTESGGVFLINVSHNSDFKISNKRK